MIPSSRRVSFVVPVHNNEPYIEQCIESIISQSLDDFEIICIDDASSDKSLDILRILAEQHPQIRLIINERNLGAGPSRNLGLDTASGRFVRIVDADDLLPANSTAAMLERALGTGADLVRGALARFIEDDLENIPFVIQTPDRMETRFSDDLDLWSPWWHTSYLIRADLLRDPATRYPDLRKGEDPVFLAEVLVRSQCASLMSDVVYYYRGYPKSSGSAGSSFVDVIDSLRHAAHVKQLYLAHCQPAWAASYGPFLQTTYRRFISGCRLDERQIEHVNREAEAIWDGGLGIASPASGEEAAREASFDKRHWEAVFAREDPWNYISAYETAKYDHTLELVPQHVGKALEIGCAEGLFTRMIAPRTERLLAIDIAQSALERAAARCVDHPHVSFLEYDIADGLPGQAYDLIVCSEILYYLRDAAAIARFARTVRDSLSPGGRLVMTHGNIVSDDRGETGFDFASIGAKGIGEIFAACPGLEFLQELRTELYRVQLFRRTSATLPNTSGLPGELLLRTHAEFEHNSIKWGGCAITSAEARHLWRLPETPVLMYHRISDEGPELLAPYRVAPAAFERQLAWLKRHGWQGMDLGTYCRHRFTPGASPLPGKPVILTFDDAYLDFYTIAWPLLQKYGFSATVFIPVDFVGGHADWDAEYGNPAALMTWDQIIELHQNGVAFGAHSCTHQRPTEMPRDAFLADAIRSKQVIEAKLGTEVPGYCYPFAAAAPETRDAAREAGFEWAVCSIGNGHLDRSDPYYLPRIEIFGGDDVERFAARLPTQQPTDDDARRVYYEMAERRDRALYMGF